MLPYIGKKKDFEDEVKLRIQGIYPRGPDVMNYKVSHKMGRKFQSQGRECGDRRTVRKRERERRRET